ncbi:MAG: D-glycero-beta-D-manno-heptose 1,7-bisphosphate 7-phosphatase [Aliarcobacter sp.]|nr:D-glycero-beta-D-manno-heptose 1,7-bisphosphate 7-phosphatase [Aliarcobacter sp.]
MIKGFSISKLLKKIIFLDRDGVINHDHGYVVDIKKFEFIDGVFDACNYFSKLGYELIVITNQSGIARKYFTEKDFLNLTKWMKEEFKNNGINILEVYYCPHGPEDNCECRKPNIGMITQANNDFDIDLQKSWLIGDKISDIQTGLNANIKNNILIKSSYNNKDKDEKIASYTANSLIDAVNIIKE